MKLFNMLRDLKFCDTYNYTDSLASKGNLTITFPISALGNSTNFPSSLIFIFMTVLFFWFYFYFYSY